jgi:hypothetical protein
MYLTQARPPLPVITDQLACVSTSEQTNHLAALLADLSSAGAGDLGQ